MLQFFKLNLSHRQQIHELLYKAHRRGCEYSFANMYFWLMQHGEVAICSDYIVCRVRWGGTLSYFYPAGTGDVFPVLEEMRADSEALGADFVLRSVTEEDRLVLEELYPNKFRFVEHRDSFDYLYSIEKLADLAGKKLQAKRNHINKFISEHPDWYVKTLTDAEIPEVKALCREWYAVHGEDESLRTEHAALDTALSNRETMGMEGIVLYNGQKAVGFSLGNRLNDTTFDVNFEKAFASVQGSYPTVNREFARYIRQKHPEITTINREDDMGIEGLRKAKESYYPDLLVKMKAFWEE